MTTRTLAVAALLLLVPAGARAADDDVQITEVARRTLAPKTILYREVETSLSEMGTTVGPIIEELQKLVKEKKVSYAGCGVFVYFGASADPTKKFKLQVSFAVAEDTKPQGEFKVRKLEPFKCLTVVYAGPLASISRAYEKAFGNLGGSVPTGETREYYLDWEGVDSPNNVELVAVGIK
jgi:effector-binding domain-containing protein